MNNIIIQENKIEKTLTIKERRHGILVTIEKFTMGAVTKTQMAYFEANIKSRITQIEADIILKYYYGLS